MSTIDLNNIERRTYKNKYFQRLSLFLLKLLYKFLQLLHRILYKILAFTLFNIIKWLWEISFVVETYLFNYLKNSKYIDNDKFDQKISREKLIMLWMGLQDCRKITLREISYELWVTEWYARKIKDIAREPNKYYYEYKKIMSEYQSDSEKLDKRSFISEKDFHRYR